MWRNQSLALVCRRESSRWPAGLPGSSWLCPGSNHSQRLDLPAHGQETLPLSQWKCWANCLGRPARSGAPQLTGTSGTIVEAWGEMPCAHMPSCQCTCRWIFHAIFLSAAQEVRLVRDGPGGYGTAVTGSFRRNIFPPNIYTSSYSEPGTVPGWPREKSQIKPPGPPRLSSARRHRDLAPQVGDPDPSRWRPCPWCCHTWIAFSFALDSGRSVQGTGSSPGDPGRVP